MNRPASRAFNLSISRWDLVALVPGRRAHSAPKLQATSAVRITTATRALTATLKRLYYDGIHGQSGRGRPLIGCHVNCLQIRPAIALTRGLVIAEAPPLSCFVS